MTNEQQRTADIAAAAKKFGLRIPPQALQRGIDPVDSQADAIENAALRFGLRIPPRDQRQDIRPVRVGEVPR